VKIAIASGKGGTGKTTLSTNLATYMAETKPVVLVDLDVEEPNSGLFVSGETIVQETKFHELLFGGLEEQGLGKWDFTPDPLEMAKRMIAHIDKKREQLGINKARERTLVDMADRRAIDAA